MATIQQGIMYGNVRLINEEDLDRILEDIEKLGLDSERAADHAIHHTKKLVTSRTLILHVQGLLAHSIAEWERLRYDPEYLYNMVFTYAQTCLETIKDEGGESNTPESLLAKPRFIAMHIRSTAYNVLLTIGGWSMILEFLQDIEKLDRDQGRLRTQEARDSLLLQVKKILNHMLNIKFQDFHHGLASEPAFRPYLMRKSSPHFEYGDCDICFLPDRTKVRQLLREESIAGMGMRVFGMSLFGFTQKYIVADISNSLISMLDEDDEDWRNAAYDERYKHHLAMLPKSEAIFKAAMIEKHITSTESLKSESKVQKIWAGIDKVSMKKEKKPIEKVVGFVDILPSWTYQSPPPPTSPPQEHSPRENQREPRERPDQVRTRPPRQTEDIPEVEPVKLQPVSYLSDIRTINGGDRPSGATATPKGPKQKRRGVPGPQASPHPEQDPLSQEIIISVTKVSEGVYDVLRQLLVRADRKTSWTEVEKTFAELGFGKTPTGGSCITFSPPSDLDIPFFVDRPHDHELERYQVRDIGKNLKRIYSWTIDMFTTDPR